MNKSKVESLKDNSTMNKTEAKLVSSYKKYIAV